MVTENISYREACNKNEKSYSSALNQNTGFRYTATLKRKRQEVNTQVDEEFLRQHREIISIPKVQSQPVFQNYRNIPNYSNEYQQNQNKDSINKTCEAVVNLIRDILTHKSANNLTDSDILKGLKDSILDILKQNE